MNHHNFNIPCIDEHNKEFSFSFENSVCYSKFVPTYLVLWNETKNNILIFESIEEHSSSPYNHYLHINDRIFLIRNEITFIQKTTPTSLFPINHEILIFSTSCIHQSLEPREKSKLFFLQYSTCIVFYCVNNPLVIVVE